MIPTILGGGKVLMYGNVVADQFQTTGDYPFGAALSVSLMVGADDRRARRRGELLLRREAIA